MLYKNQTVHFRVQFHSWIKSTILFVNPWAVRLLGYDSSASTCRIYSAYLVAPKYADDRSIMEIQLMSWFHSMIVWWVLQCKFIVSTTQPGRLIEGLRTRVDHPIKFTFIIKKYCYSLVVLLEIQINTNKQNLV